ncbi:hypothetical protein F4810DRAFT_725174 [Camillea tinctor]|nr:hypothetical protein F4810DRAFT_725174 [Camillea tinctor]
MGGQFAPVPTQGCQSSGDGDQTPAKRQRGISRSSKACDFCTTYHRSCDNKWPVCTFCVARGNPCTYNKPTRKRGPKSPNLDKIAERFIALASRNPHLTRSLINEVLNGRDSLTGRRNIDIIQDPAEKTNLLASFDESRVANFLNDYQAGKYTQPQTELPYGPLGHRIEAYSSPSILKSAQSSGGNNTPTHGPFPASIDGTTPPPRQVIAPGVLQSGPAARYSLPESPNSYNPPGYQHNVPVPQQHNAEPQKQQEQQHLPSPQAKEEPDDMNWALDIPDDE